jgi:hypothetical protein
VVEDDVSMQMTISLKVACAWWWQRTTTYVRMLIFLKVACARWQTRTTLCGFPLPYFSLRL